MFWQTISKDHLILLLLLIDRFRISILTLNNPFTILINIDRFESIEITHLLSFFYDMGILFDRISQITGIEVTTFNPELVVR